MIFNKFLRINVLARLISLCLLTGCRLSPTNVGPDQITSINIINHDGMAETISSKDRLSAYEKTDFLNPQPYQKVLRTFGRDAKGNIASLISSYHPNGQVKQYLEALNNRAFGTYKEWFSNGQLKVETRVVGGMADLNTQAEESWLFDGLCRAWDEDGHLIAEIPYSKGELQGTAQYYHPSGRLWKAIPYEKDQIHGLQKIYLEDGELFQTTAYQKGVKEGTSVRYWNETDVAYEEHYVDGRLEASTYYDRDGKVVSEIRNGSGFRAIFGKRHLQELQEYHEGLQEGVVKMFAPSGTVIRTFSIKNGEKHGEEIDYQCAADGTMQPKLLMTWKAGTLQGPVKTWYPDGGLENHREMSQNKRSGLSTAWYPTGELMLVEEYDEDRLIKGEYYRLGNPTPVSTVTKGEGVATLYDTDGNVAQKVTYRSGKPLA